MDTTLRRGMALGSLALAGALVMGGAGTAGAAVTVSAAKGGSVQGQVAFDCLLLPFNSAFRYEGPATIGAPSEAGAEGLALTGQFPEIPGIAPVAIENGNMRIWTKGTAGGNEVELKGATVVNAGASQPVPLPEMEGVVQGVDAATEVELSSFGFEFDEMMGLDISAQCDAVDSGKAGTFALKSSASASDDSKADEPSAALGEAAEGGNDTLVKVALWGVPVALLVAGVLVWLPRRKAAGS